MVVGQDPYLPELPPLVALSGLADRAMSLNPFKLGGVWTQVGVAHLAQMSISRLLFRVYFFIDFNCM